MALKSELMAAGMPVGQASKIGFDTPNITVAAAGANQAAATPLVSNFAIIASGSGGVIINERHSMTCVFNNSGGAVNVYPPVGSSINAGAANAAFSLSNGKSALIVSAGTNFMLNMSA